MYYLDYQNSYENSIQKVVTVIKHDIFSFQRQIRRLRNTAADLRGAVAMRQNVVTRKLKSIKDPKTLTFYFGVNVMNRACDGMFVYNCSRLIKMYQRIGPQQDSSMMCRGVVGIVDVPYMVLGEYLFK